MLNPLHWRIQKCPFGHCLAIKITIDSGFTNVWQFKQNYCKKLNKVIAFNTNILIKVSVIHKCPFSFILVQAFYIINTHVNQSFVIRLSSRFTRSWCSQYRLTDKSMLMFISKTLFRVFLSNCSREGTSYSSSGKDRRTSEQFLIKLLPTKQQPTKWLNSVRCLCFRIHFIRCGQAFAFNTRATHSMNQKEDVTLTPY